MTNADVMSWICNRLSPEPVRDWFIAASPEIEQAVTVIAFADGLEAALHETKQLYLAWIALPAP